MLFIGGCAGVGKSSVAAEIHAQLSRQHVTHAVIEGDYLDLAWPAPHEQGLHLAEMNLQTIWRNYYAAGYRRLLYTNTVSVRADVMADLIEALGDDLDADGVLLTAGGSAIAARLAARERGTTLDEHLVRSERAAADLANRTPSHVVHIDTTNKTVTEVAMSIIEQIGWMEIPSR